MSEGKYCSDDGDRGILPDPGMTATPTGMRAKDAGEMELGEGIFFTINPGVKEIGGLVSRQIPLGVPTRDATKALLIQMREYIFHHQIPIGECVAWNELKEMYGVGVDREKDVAWLNDYQQKGSES